MKGRSLVQIERHSEEPDTLTTALAPLPSPSLTSFENTVEGRAVEHLEARLRNDAELVTRLMFGGYEGSDWTAAANRLVAYGHRVIRAWILDGSIVRECQSKSWHVEWSDTCRNPEVATDIATMVVAVALQHFRDEVLIPGKWDPQRGASLSTFFVGQCILRYGNEFKAWKRSQLRSARGAEAARWDREPGVPDGASQVMDKADIARYLKNADPITERALRLRAADYSWEEISELTDLSVSAVRGRVTRFQTQNRRRREAS
jgi:hypothetical protein